MFRTLYYNLECDFIIEKTGVKVTLERKYLKLDYKDSETFYFKDSIYNVFSEELSKYSDLYLLDSRCKQIENQNQDVVIYVEDDFLIATDRVSFIASKEINYKKFIDGENITFKVSDDYEYTIEVVDGDHTEKNVFNGSYSYRVKTKSIFVLICKLYNGAIVSSFSETIHMNDTGEVEQKTPQLEEAVNSHSNPKFFKSGIEEKPIKFELSTSKDKEEFSLTANFLSVSQDKTMVYPQVAVDYKIKTSYEVPIPEINSEFEYSSSYTCDGYIAAKIVKLHTKPYKCTYKLNARITYFKEVNGIKSWVTEGVSKAREYSTSVSDMVFINENTMKVDFAKKFKQEKERQSVYSVIKEAVAESLGNIGNFIVSSYLITEVKNYVDGEFVEKSCITPILPCANDILPSEPISHFISPVYIYTGERIISKMIKGQDEVVVSSSDFNFELSDQFGDTVNDNGTSRLFVLESSPNISFNKTSNSLTASVDVILESKRVVKYNNSFKSSIEYMTSQRSSLTDMFRVEADVRCTKGTVYIDGKELSAGQSLTVVREGPPSTLLFGGCGKPYTVWVKEEQTGDRKTAYINGEEGTYKYDAKGYADYNEKQEPFMYPSFARNIKTSVEFLSVIPKDATYEKVITDSTNTREYSLSIKLSSSYTSFIDTSKTVIEESQVFDGFYVNSGLKKEITLSFKKPSSQNNYNLSIVSNNHNVKIDGPLSIDFSKGSDVKVIATSVIHPANKWNLDVSPFYFYSSEDEYMAFEKSGTFQVFNGKVELPFAYKTEYPLAVKSGDVNLTRVVYSKENIVEETISADGVFYLKHKSFGIISVKGEKGQSVKYKITGSAILANEKMITVSYKVNNSFDYTVKDGKTIITLTAKTNGYVEVFYNKNLIDTGLSLNPIHTLYDKGFVVFNKENKPVTSVKSYTSEFKNYKKIIIIMQDEDRNKTYSDFRIATSSKYSYTVKDSVILLKVFDKTKAASIYINGKSYIL